MKEEIIENIRSGVKALGEALELLESEPVQAEEVRYVCCSDAANYLQRVIRIRGDRAEYMNGVTVANNAPNALKNLIAYPENFEIPESALPYLERPEGDWEFRQAEVGDSITIAHVTDEGVVHGREDIVVEGYHMHELLNGYRWCRHRKEEDKGLWVDGSVCIDGKTTKAKFWVEG